MLFDPDGSTTMNGIGQKWAKEGMFIAEKTFIG